MYKKCEYCGNLFEVFHDSRFCSKTCQGRAYREKHSETYNFKKPTTLRKDEYKKKAENNKRRKKRRDDINKLMQQTGLYNKYGLVAYFYDNNDIKGLFEYCRQYKAKKRLGLCTKS